VSASTGDAIPRFDIVEAEVVDLLSRLVAIPSTNVMVGGQPEDACYEYEIAPFVRDQMVGLGLDVQIQDVVDGRANVLGIVRGPQDGPTVLLDAHMDTVPGVEMEIEPFSPVVRDGRLYGRGACDTKGALAAMICAAAALRKLGAPPATVIVSATVDEEARFRGILKVIESGIRADAAVVGEPTQLDIVTAHKGVVRYQVVTHGKAAHSANPQRGVNAIYHMCRVVEGIESKIIPALNAKTHPLLDAPRITVGKIRGGRQANIVPESCTIDVDRRTLPGETREDALGEIQALLDALHAEDPQFDAQVIEPHTVQAGLETPTDHPFVQALCAAVRRVRGRPRVAGVPYATHASPLHSAGIPSVVFGPGDIQYAHAAVEFVPIREVVQAAEILAEACFRFGVSQRA
jgi:succinyl-diaminopimelate desuccinylase